MGCRDEGPGSAAAPGAVCSVHSLGWVSYGERRWHGLAEAQPDVLHQAWDAAGAAYLLHTQVFPASLSPRAQPQLQPFSLGLRTYPRPRLPQPWGIP